MARVFRMGSKQRYVSLVVWLWIILGKVSLFSPGSVCANEMSWQEILDHPIVISLQRSHRFPITKQRMKHAGFTNIEYFEGVDGSITSQDFFTSLNIQDAPLLLPGEKGCAASHLLVWEKFIQSSDSREYLFVAEDDILPHPKFAKIFPLYWENTPKPFDLILVGYRDINRNDGEDLHNRFLIRAPKYCTHAYIISKEGAKKLLEAYRNMPISTYWKSYVIDCFLSDQMEKKNINYYCYNGELFSKGMPHTPIRGICFQDASFENTIDWYSRD